MFDDWKDVGESYFHSFGLTGKDHWSAGFQHFWMHGLTKGHEQSYDDYCLELVAARESKFAHLPDERMNYAYQLDSTLYAKFLRQMSEADGTKRVEGKIANFDVNGDTLQSINGFELTSADKALEVYTKLREATSLEVNVTRRGKPVTLKYTIR